MERFVTCLRPRPLPLGEPSGHFGGGGGLQGGGEVVVAPFESVEAVLSFLASGFGACHLQRMGSCECDRMLFILLWLLCCHAHKTVDDFPYYEQFLRYPNIRLQDMTTVFGCVKYNEYGGLYTIPNVCFGGARYGGLFARCPSLTNATKAELAVNFDLGLWPAGSFDRLLDSMPDRTWLSGTAFLSMRHVWPHNIEHLWPVMNTLALGLPLTSIGIYLGPYGIAGRRVEYHERHSYFVALMKVIADHFNLKTIASSEVMPSTFKWRDFVKGRLLCFERIVVPSQNSHRCTPAFVNPLAMEYKWEILHRFYRIAKQQARSTPLSVAAEFPQTPPWKVVLLNRLQGRRLLNEKAIVRMIEGLGVPVDVVVFEEATLAEQFLRVAQAGLLISPHGANLVNALLLPRDAVVIEVFPVPARYWCEWTQYLQKSGVRTIEFCVNTIQPKRACPYADRHRPFPKNDSDVDVDALRVVVQDALSLIRPQTK